MGLAKRGDKTAMGYENSDGSTDVYGTALELSSKPDADICCQVTPNFDVEELTADTVGCGGVSGFGTEKSLGTVTPSVSLEGDVGFSNGFDRILAQFMGASSVPAVTGTGGYKHILTFAPTSNLYFGTFAFETSSSDILELKSTFATRVGFTMDKVRNYIRWSADLLGNAIECDSALSVNSNADLQGLTAIDKELVLPQCTSKFLMKKILDNGSDTALNTTTDIFKITSFDLQMENPLEVIPEMTGTDCSKPVEQGARVGTLTLGVKEHTNNKNASFCNFLAGDYYMADFKVLGSALGAAFKTLNWRMPKMILDSVDYSVTDPGVNPVTLTFTLLDSKNLMPGFTTTGVEYEVINKRATRYLVP